MVLQLCNALSKFVDMVLSCLSCFGVGLDVDYFIPRFLSNTRE